MRLKVVVRKHIIKDCRKGVRSMSTTINVVELFAGVGGFRLGLERADKSVFKTVWANQWEPSRKSQHAFDCYTSHFSEGEQVNTDIALVPNTTFEALDIDLVVGGFPCQDYSVARSLSGEKGLQGKKGVLFWEIKRVLENSHPRFVLLENVDRLLKSPSKQRGRDFAVMLAVFRDLGYSVEWRVINAAEYGHAQRRRRVFIFAYKNELEYAKKQQALTHERLLFQEGFFASSFPVENEPFKKRYATTTLPLDVVAISDEFSFEFHTAGVMHKGEVTTTQPTAKEIAPTPLAAIIEPEVEETYYLTEAEDEKFTYLRGAKKIERISATGHKYIYAEGGMSPVDDLALPGRTMLTSEGSVNRSTHIIEVNGRKRYLTPLECERLNGFDDNWTEGMLPRMRYFCMGNALVVPLITTMGKKIKEINEQEPEQDLQITFHL